MNITCQTCGLSIHWSIVEDVMTPVDGGWACYDHEEDWAWGS